MNSGGWQSISLEDAKQRDYYGFGGWLLAFYVYALFLVGWHLSSLLGDGRGMLMMFETPENAETMKIVLIIKTILWIPFLVLAPLKRPSMPAVTIGCIVAATLVDAVTVLFVIDLSGTKIIAINVFNLLVLLAYSTYLMKSKRINLTYRHRI